MGGIKANSEQSYDKILDFTLNRNDHISVLKHWITLRSLGYV